MSVYYHNQAKLARRITAFILLLIGVSLTVALYYVKTRAQSAKKEGQRLERLINSEVATLAVLKAEIAHLESPERLKALSKAELGLVSTDVEQVVSLADIETLFPLREPVVEVEE